MSTVVRLGDVATIDVGLPFKSADFTRSPADVRLLRGDNVSQRTLSWETAMRWPAELEVDAKYRMREGDVVLAMDRPWVGAGLKRARLRAEDVPSYLVQRVARLRATDRLSQGFLSAIIDSDAFSEYLVAVQTGTAIPHISSAQIAGFSFALPPLPEQQAIAEVLGALDDKIAANTALVSGLDQYAAALVEESLSDEMVRLDSLATITMGSSPKGETLNEAGNGVPFFQGVRDFGVRFPTRRVFTTSPVRVAAEGDVLISVRAPVGDLNIAGEDLCIGRGVAAARSKHGRQASLFHQLRAERSAWEPFEAEGTVFGSINRDQLHGIQLRTIDSNRADDVERDLGGVESVIAGLLAESLTLAATRDALLPQLMSGKLRVRDAEAAASAAGA